MFTCVWVDWKWTFLNVSGWCVWTLEDVYLPLSQWHLNVYLSVFYVFVRYEPELHPAAIYTMIQPKATIKVFSTGSVTILGLDFSLFNGFIYEFWTIHRHLWFQLVFTPISFRTKCGECGRCCSACLPSAVRESQTCVRSKWKIRGDGAFSAAGSKLWNLLLPHIRQTLSLSSFKTS